MGSRSDKIGCLGALFILLGIGKGKGPVTLPYRVRNDFLSPAELSFYHVLASVIGTNAVIMTKVRLADLFFVLRSHKQIAAFNRIAQRHIDFLVCKPHTMKPLFGIELDDASHAQKNRAKPDEFLDRTFLAAGLSLLRIRAQAAYNTREIAEKIKPYIDASNPTLIGNHSKPESRAVTISPHRIATTNATPFCPNCGQPMVLRTGTKGAYLGKPFYGCQNFPRCRTILPVTSP